MPDDHVDIIDAAGEFARVSPMPDEFQGDMADWVCHELDGLLTDEQVAEVRQQLTKPSNFLQEMYAKYQAELVPTRGPAPGGSFVLDVPEVPPAIWGDGQQLLWVKGEGFMITGPQGVGKSTIGEQLVMGLCGLRDELLGLPVHPVDGTILYLAMDRPDQIARSWRRMASEGDRDVLNERLKVWKGPLPFNVTAEPRMLAAWARDDFGAKVIVVDSYKDMAPDLSDGVTGSKINAAVQEALAEGIEWVGLHHGRKAQSENKAPKALSDVYGSNWLTAGLGSVLLLWGEPGDTIVEARHLKQPAEVVGPLSVEHDHAAGRSTVTDAPVNLGTTGKQTKRRQEVLKLIEGADEGVTLEDVKASVTGADKTLREDLHVLKETGLLIVDEAPGRATRWRRA